MAFMKYSDRRDLREKMYRLYSSRNTKGQYSNLDNIRRISEIRLQIARLLGAKTYADHSLQRTMAENPTSVYDLLGRLRKSYKPALDKEMAELTEFASGLEGKPIDIMPWDYSYYSNKLKAEKYSFDVHCARYTPDRLRSSCAMPSPGQSWGLIIISQANRHRPIAN